VCFDYVIDVVIVHCFFLWSFKFMFWKL
jgi:hypothetical protein